MRDVYQISLLPSNLSRSIGSLWFKMHSKAYEKGFRMDIGSKILMGIDKVALHKNFSEKCSFTISDRNPLWFLQFLWDFWRFGFQRWFIGRITMPRDSFPLRPSVAALQHLVHARHLPSRQEATVRLHSNYCLMISDIMKGLVIIYSIYCILRFNNDPLIIIFNIICIVFHDLVTIQTFFKIQPKSTESTNDSIKKFWNEISYKVMNETN